MGEFRHILTFVEREGFIALNVANDEAALCGTKNFSSVRLYSAPQLHWTIVTIPGICAWDRGFATASAKGITQASRWRPEGSGVLP
jgi:hypothetical protein